MVFNLDDGTYSSWYENFDILNYFFQNFLQRFIRLSIELIRIFLKSKYGFLELSSRDVLKRSYFFDLLAVFPYKVKTIKDMSIGIILFSESVLNFKM
ncbi:hypothetical protein D3C86_998820 [compost metagenome]